MNMISTVNLARLIETSGEPCVSIYMPTERAGQAVEKNRIRLKNMLAKAEERLGERGLRRPAIADLLQPAHALLDDVMFWQRQSDGLALYICDDQFDDYRLPLDFEERLVVADSLHIKPLLPLISSNGRFYILALSQDEVRLLQCTRYTAQTVELKETPESLAEILQWDDPEKRMQFHTSTQSPAGARARPRLQGERPAVFHGHGTASADDEKDYILRYFHQLEKGITQITNDTHAPLVLAAVDYLHPIYREANTYPRLIEKGVVGNPEQASAGELHAQAWALVEPILSKEQQEAEAAYEELAGMGHEQAADDLRDVAPAARAGRVRTLFVPVDVQRWGTFDEETFSVEVRDGAGDQARPGDVDLLDMAAVHTLLNDGAVYAVKAEDMPGDGVLAAVLRY